MKKLVTIILSIWATSSFAQSTNQAHFSVVQGLSTDGKASKKNDYYFSFNLFSGTINNLNGAEIGSLYNQNNGNMTGFQSSGLVNYTKGTVKGYQTAGLANVAEDVKGVQHAGLSNHAKNVVGVQTSGIINQAKTLKGFQLGLINVAETVEKGGGIGLLNLYKNGYREVELSVSDYQNIGVSFKSGMQHIYTIVNVGYKTTSHPLLSSGLGIGQVYKLKRGLFFKPELIWYNYYQDDFKFNSSSQASHLKVGIMKRMGNFGITLSPSVYYANIPKNLEGTLTKTSKLKPLSQTNKGRFGYGLSLGISWLK